MPCENCERNNRSIGYENGDEISCKHCGTHLQLVDRYNDKGGRWIIFKDVVE